MLRVEIFSNKSIEEDITDALEQYIKDIQYTKIPLAYGKGGEDYKMGTTTWPETNFVLISYIEDNQLNTVKTIIEKVKQKFNREGVRMFVTKAEVF